MVAARVRDGGGKFSAKSFASQLIVADQASETYNRILEEVQAISCATLFAPVMSNEAVQAMSTLFISAPSAAAYLYSSPCLWLVGQRLAQWWSCCPHGHGVVQVHRSFLTVLQDVTACYSHAQSLAKIT